MSILHLLIFLFTRFKHLTLNPLHHFTPNPTDAMITTTPRTQATLRYTTPPRYILHATPLRRYHHKLLHATPLYATTPLTLYSTTQATLHSPLHTTSRYTICTTLYTGSPRSSTSYFTLHTIFPHTLLHRPNLLLNLVTRHTLRYHYQNHFTQRQHKHLRWSN